MHRVSASFALMVALLTPGLSSAQTITVIDTNGPRLGGSVSYGGHGVDWEMSLDSRTLWNRVRFRAQVGQGRWVGWEDTAPPAGTNPTVTRAGVSIIRNGPFDPYAPIRAFGGIGLTALIPRRVEMNPALGIRAVVGIEAVGNDWSIGPELQLDLPARARNQFSIDAPGSYLTLTARIGIFARRRI